MIGGIGSLYGSYYNYQLTINQIRQQQALAKNPNVQKYMESTSKPDRYDDQYRSSGLDFLRDYNSKMSDVMQAANSLKTNNSAGVMNSLVTVSYTHLDVYKRQPQFFPWHMMVKNPVCDGSKRRKMFYK